MTQKSHLTGNLIPGEFYPFCEVAKTYYRNEYDAFCEYVIENWRHFNDGLLLKVERNPGVETTANTGAEISEVFISDWGIDCLFNLYDRVTKDKKQ